ncbi:MAG: hypothetical protein ACI4QX_05345 [Lachnospiraceae bacterium]
MEPTESAHNSKKQQQVLLALCRFLSLRLLHGFMLILLFATGCTLSLLNRSQFAPYGIAVVCLILPSFISGSSGNPSKKENSDMPLATLCNRYHYSPVFVFSYRVSFLLCSLLLFFWHLIQNPVLSLWGISLPLLYLAVNLALYPILSRCLFWHFHRRLMSGRL